MERIGSAGITSDFPVILPQSEASSKLHLRGPQVVEEMVTLTSSSWKQISRWLRQLDAVLSTAQTLSGGSTPARGL
jgi:hypothetical protein